MSPRLADNRAVSNTRFTARTFPHPASPLRPMPHATPLPLAAAFIGFAVAPAGAQVTLTNFPADEQLVARASVADATATFEVAGTSQSATELTLRLLDGATVESEVTAQVTPGSEFALPLAIPVTRRAFGVELLAGDDVVAAAERVVAGDVFVVAGQSNAIAGYAMSAPDRDSFLRGFSVQTAEPYDWSLLGLAAPGETAGRAASLLSRRHDVPIAVFNFGVGAKDVAFFRAGATEPHPFNDTSVRLGDSSLTNFETVRDQLAAAGALGRVRGVIWAQGEGNSFETPLGAYAEQLGALMDEYRDRLGIERMYGIQTRFGACGGTQPFVMEDQRQLAARRGDIDFTASTNVAQDADDCHFAFSRENPTTVFGLRRIGDWVADLISAGTYGVEPALGAAAFSPDVDSARVTGEREITLYFDESGAQMAATGSPWGEFAAEGLGADVRAVGGEIRGNEVALAFDTDVGLATGATYLSHTGPSTAFLHNAEGVGAFTFYDVPTIPGDGVPGNLPDVELTLTSDDEVVTPGEFLTVEVVLANTGRSTARALEVVLPIPPGANVGYVGALIPTPAVGSFDPGTNVWTVPALAPGREVAMTVTYFTQATTPATVTLWAAVSAQAGGDEDSAPGNAIGAGLAEGTVREDDEARLVFGDRARDCVLSVEPVASGCDVDGGTWTLELAATAGAADAVEVSGLPGVATATVSLATAQRYTFDYEALRAAGDTVLAISAVVDATCANVFALAPPASCTGGPPVGLFAPRPDALPLALAPNPVRAGRAVRVTPPAELVGERAELVDATGRRVWSGRATAAFAVPTEGLAGVYVLRVGRGVSRLVVR